MKKLVLATILAAATGLASAQTNVTLYGAYSNGITNTTTGGVRAPTAMNDAKKDHLGTSALGIKGTEDLGGGNSVFFNLEGDLQGTGTLGADSGTSTNTFNRQAHVGLSSTTFGTLTLGRQNDSVKDTEVLGQVYNLSDNLGNKTRVGDRITNATKYTSPTVFGLRASYTYSNSPYDSGSTGLDSAVTHNSYAVYYTIPKIGTEVAAARGQEKEVGVANKTTTRYSARHTINGIVLAGAYTVNDYNGDKTKQTLVSTLVPVPGTKFDVRAHYINNSASNGTGNSTDGLDGKAYGGMVVYNFSPRTATFAGYNKQDYNGTANDVKTTTVGLLHKF